MKLRLEDLSPKQIAAILRVRTLASAAHVKRVPRTELERRKLNQFLFALEEHISEIFPSSAQLRVYLQMRFEDGRRRDNGAAVGQLPPKWHKAALIYLNKHAGEVPRRLIWPELGITRDSLGRLIRKAGIDRALWKPVEMTFRDKCELVIPESRWPSLKTVHLGLVADAYNLDFDGLLRIQPFIGPEMLKVQDCLSEELTAAKKKEVEWHLGVWRRFKERYLKRSAGRGVHINDEQYVIGRFYTAIFPGWLTSKQLGEALDVSQNQMTVFTKAAGYGSTEALLKAFEKQQLAIVKRLKLTVPGTYGEIEDIILAKAWSEGEGVDAVTMAAQHRLGPLSQTGYESYLAADLSFLDTGESREYSIFKRAAIYRFATKHQGRCSVAAAARVLGMKAETFMNHANKFGVTHESWHEAEARYVSSIRVYFENADWDALDVVFAQLCSKVCKIPEFTIRESFFPATKLSDLQRHIRLDLSAALPKCAGKTQQQSELERVLLRGVMERWPGWFSDEELGDYFGLNHSSVSEFRLSLNLDAEEHARGRMLFMSKLSMAALNSSWPLEDIVVFLCFLRGANGNAALAAEHRLLGERGVGQYRGHLGYQLPPLKRKRGEKEVEQLTLFGQAVVIRTLERWFGAFPLVELAKLLGISLNTVRYALEERLKRTTDEWQAAYQSSAFRKVVLERSRKQAAAKAQKRHRQLLQRLLEEREALKDAMESLPIRQCSIPNCELGWGFDTKSFFYQCGESAENGSSKSDKKQRQGRCRICVLKARMKLAA